MAAIYIMKAYFQYFLTLSFIASTLASPLGLAQVKRQCPTMISSYPPPRLASGYTAVLAGTGFRYPRQIIFDKQGRLLLLDRGIGIRSMRIDDECGLIFGDDIIVNDTKLNHGLTMSVDGTKLFASDINAAYIWDYNSAAGTVSGKRTLVNGMPSGGHSTRSLLIPKSNPDLLLISVGSNGNLDSSTTSYSSGRSQIRGFKWKDLLKAPVAYNKGSINFGWGLRNSVGIRDDRKSMLWSVENSADNLVRNGVDIHTNNPAEELNFHGSVKDTYQRSNYGYPLCFAVGDLASFPSNSGLTRGTQFALNPSNTFTDKTCKTNYQPPRLSFPAHSAPLDILFDNDGNAWVTFHGSWNRSPPTGYQLIRIPFNQATGQPVAANSSSKGYETIMWNENVAQCPGSCFRPTSLALRSDGAIYMTSDATGQIYRIRKSAK